LKKDNIEMDEENAVLFSFFSVEMCILSSFSFHLPQQSFLRELSPTRIKFQLRFIRPVQKILM